MSQVEPSFWTANSHVITPAAIAIMGFIFSIVIYREKVNNLHKDVEEIKKEQREIRDRIIVCETCLNERGSGKYIQKKSPLSLTEDGMRLLKRSGGQSFIDENFNDLFIEVEEKAPKTAYDIQELSRAVLKRYEPDDKFIPLKEYAFKEGLQLDILVDVMGIDLRDRILKKKGWDVKEVDKHDPLQTPNK